MAIDWDTVFRETHLDSGPSSFGLTISKIKPNGLNARSIWNDDKHTIMKAAARYGYRILLENSHVTSFIKNKS
jgi:hypothetical protein